MRKVRCLVWCSFLRWEGYNEILSGKDKEVWQVFCIFLEFQLLKRLVVFSFNVYIFEEDVIKDNLGGGSNYILNFILIIDFYII